MSNEVITEKRTKKHALTILHCKLTFTSSLNLKCRLTNNDIATVYIGLCILLFIITVKATQQMMCEIIFIIHVSMRNNAEAYVSHIMCETW